jgi:molybdopterin-guanine dinucleotide biosynthesis protein A
MIDIPCIIFAGGKSSRMGRDKALLPFSSSKTLTEYQLRRLEKLFSSVYISCKEKKKFQFEAHFIEDIDSNTVYAPTAGFLAVYQTLNVERFFVLSVDTPFVTQEEIEKLIEMDDSSYDATIAISDEGLQPLCGIYHRSLEKEFQKMFEQNNHKLGFLLKESKTNSVKFTSKRFMNLNFEDEYKKALNIIKKRKK